MLPKTPPALPTLVLCIDDSPDITAVMKMIIDTDPGMLCVGCLSCADRLVEKVRGLSAEQDSPRVSLVLLLDATMPGASPLAVMSELAAQFPAVRTIFYSGYHDQPSLDQAKKAGAWGWISKSDEPEVILQAVRSVAAGDAWWPRTKHRS
jgi:DNA-binding NarL/FixJ family response regulator